MEKKRYFKPKAETVAFPLEDFIARSNRFNFADANTTTFEVEEEDEDEELATEDEEVFTWYDEI